MHESVALNARSALTVSIKNYAACAQTAPAASNHDPFGVSALREYAVLPDRDSIKAIMKGAIRTAILFATLCVVLPGSRAYARDNSDWHAHQIESLPLDTKLVFVDKPSIRGSIHNKVKTSLLAASMYDRLLFILDGDSTVSVGSNLMAANEGDVIFLKAQDAVRFADNIKIMTWTSKSPNTTHRHETGIFTKQRIEAERRPLENIWHSFIDTPTMVAGLYMLPQHLNGDQTLLHDMDEINYVVNGTAKFRMNDKVINVKPGSVIWVKRGVGHNFYDLSEDFDVFILFETINMNHEH